MVVMLVASCQLLFAFAGALWWSLCRTKEDKSQCPGSGPPTPLSILNHEECRLDNISDMLCYIWICLFHSHAIRSLSTTSLLLSSAEGFSENNVEDNDEHVTDDEDATSAAETVISPASVTMDDGGVLLYC